MSTKKFLSKYSTLFHKWLGLVIGIQVLLWIAGGFVMSYYEIEVVRSEHNIAAPEPVVFSAEMPLVSVSSILAQMEEPVEQVTLRPFLGQPVYEVILQMPEASMEASSMEGSGAIQLFDAMTGQQLTPLSAEVAATVAEADFVPDARPSEPQWITEHNKEYRAELPMWRIDMNDAEGTHIYVSPFTGKVRARRSDVWRLYDFFWMLHIMDYKNRTDFNNPLLIWASLFAVIFSITGIIMLFFRFKRRDFGIGNGK